MKLFFIVIIALVFLSACNTNNDFDLKNVPSEKREKKLDELLKLGENEKLYATMQTSMGDIKFELFVEKVPKTVKNFVGLASMGYYDGIIFHRVIDKFMIQGGDPTGTGRGGQSFWGDSFEDEFDASLVHDVPGILSMANAGPNTNGSQFFITLVPTPWLNNKHSIFGKVVEGMDVVEAIGKVETGAMDKPAEDITIKTVVVEKK